MAPTGGKKYLPVFAGRLLAAHLRRRSTKCIGHLITTLLRHLIARHLRAALLRHLVARHLLTALLRHLITGHLLTVLLRHLALLAALLRHLIARHLLATLSAILLPTTPVALLAMPLIFLL